MNDLSLTSKIKKCASPTDEGSTDGSGECTMITMATTFELPQVTCTSSRRTDYSCTVVSVRYPSALDRWLERQLTATNDDYEEGRRSKRIAQPLRLYFRSSLPHAQPMRIFEWVDRGRLDGEAPEPVYRLAERPFQCLNLFVHDAVEVYQVLGRIRHILSYNPTAARRMSARLQLQAVDIPTSDPPDTVNNIQWPEKPLSDSSLKARSVASSFDEYREKMAARHRDVRNIRSAYGMFIRPYAPDSELI